VGIGRLVCRGSDTGLARARVRSWGNGEQQQDDGRVGKGLVWICWCVAGGGDGTGGRADSSAAP
jgi:hypothetical protein